MATAEALAELWWSDPAAGGGFPVWARCTSATIDVDLISAGWKGSQLDGKAPVSRRETGAFHVRNSRTASTATKEYDELAPLCMTGKEPSRSALGLKDRATPGSRGTISAAIAASAGRQDCQLNIQPSCPSFLCLAFVHRLQSHTMANTVGTPIMSVPTGTPHP